MGQPILYHGAELPEITGTEAGFSRMINSEGRNYPLGERERTFHTEIMETSTLSTELLRFAALEARVAELETLIREGVLPAVPKLSIENDTLYNVQEVARTLRCGKTNVYDLIESGQLAVTRIGNGRKGMRVRGADLAAFLDARKEGGPAPKTRFIFLKNMN
jgi:excisionase family DNA binding protein